MDHNKVQAIANDMGRIIGNCDPTAAEFLEGCRLAAQGYFEQSELPESIDLNEFAAVLREAVEKCLH